MRIPRKLAAVAKQRTEPARHQPLPGHAASEGGGYAKRLDLVLKPAGQLFVGMAVAEERAVAVRARRADFGQARAGLRQRGIPSHCLPPNPINQG